MLRELFHYEFTCDICMKVIICTGTEHFKLQTLSPRHMPVGWRVRAYPVEHGTYTTQRIQTYCPTCKLDDE